MEGSCVVSFSIHLYICMSNLSIYIPNNYDIVLAVLWPCIYSGGALGVICLSVQMSMLYLRKCGVTNPFIYLSISLHLCILGVVDLSIYRSIYVCTGQAIIYASI